MRIHLIAIGGSAMHNVAMALHRMGHEVTGSDDAIFEPSRSRLDKEGLLPEIGWNEKNISNELDAVILGMHARENNPELQKAIELDIPVYSYPEFVYEQTKHQRRFVVAGSHGKTSITSMILHVLKDKDMRYSYLVGAQLEGYDCMVQFDKEAEIAIFEGDEYLSSPLDRRPKFFHYQADVAVISGIAWDHVNVFKTFESYQDQFKHLISQIPNDGKLFYYEPDNNLKRLASSSPTGFPYQPVQHAVEKEQTVVSYQGKSFPMNVFGEHNMANMSAAIHMLKEMGISFEESLKSLESFTGAAKRLEVVKKGADWIIYKDFAHAPSKVEATVKAVREQYETRKITCLLELHTFSSLNIQFIKDYKGAFEGITDFNVFYDPEAVAHKKLPALIKEEVQEIFKGGKVLNTKTEVVEVLHGFQKENSVLLVMTSGNLGGIKLEDEV